MSFGVEDFIDGIHASRQYFLRHINGLKDDQWDWKPYPECKSIRETIAHMITDDRAFIYLLDSGDMPDYSSIMETEHDINKLMAILAKTHDELCAFIKTKFTETPLDNEFKFISYNLKLGQILTSLSHEDYYHAGQVAFIRMATDPSWDYYKEIYGGM